MSADLQLGASFRDPSGFVFRKNGVLLRQVNRPYLESLKRLTDSGLYGELTEAGLLIPHTEVGIENAFSDEAVAVLKPERISTISYPYEWCFSQLKDAALTTLRIQSIAMKHGMSLKDASAYNIQFHHGGPVFIDTLSFEPYDESSPWKPYRQFCQHFLAPLVLMSFVDIRLSRLAASYIDGIPLDLASSLSSSHTRFKPGIGMHLHLHARMQAKNADAGTKKETRGGFGKNALLGLIDSLQSTIEGLKWKPEGTEWADYYSDTNYSDAAMIAKHKLVAEYLGAVSPAPNIVWDLGANNGEFSAVSTSMGFQTVAWDIDPAAVEKNYLQRRADKLMLPLVQDLTNPSPSIGWALRERDSLIERGPANAMLVLALIHHLAIGNNVPLLEIASFLARAGEWLVIEFVPKDDSQVQRLLASREDVFPDYTQEQFEASFQGRFTVIKKDSVPGTVRTLYLMKRRAS